MACSFDVKDCTVAVYTLGCKLNQLESESIASVFIKEGFPLVKTESDDFTTPSILIINTCTVTSKSEQKARRYIRKVLRENTRLIVIVTGCYAQLEAETLEELDVDSSQTNSDKRLFVISGDKKNRLLELPGFLAANADISNLAGAVSAWINNVELPVPLDAGSTIEDACFSFKPGDFSFHSRSFIKIQDGCNNQCSYCRVRIARGRSRSQDSFEVLQTLKSLEEKGYEESVLTGVNISQYAGAYKDGFINLTELLEYLLSETQKIRIRLSSIEPESGLFSPAFIKIISHNRIRPHFHLSLQAASSAILKRMNRSYSPEQAMEYIMMLRAAKTDPFLGCDIITGFPGETEKEFDETFEFCQRVRFAGIHAFPFSRRPGTEAWNFKDRVTEREAGIRAEKLIELAVKQRREYVIRWIGREVEAIAEQDGAALSENYLKLCFIKSGIQPKPGKAYRCRILEKQAFSRCDALAEIILE